MDTNKFESPLKFYKGAGAFLQALHQPINEPFTQMIEDLGATEGADGILAQVAAGAHPKEALTADYLARSPYANPRQLIAGLKESEERGWITLSETGFTATGKALDLYQKIIDILIDRTTDTELDQADVARAVELLGKLVQGAGKADFAIKPTFTFARSYEYEDKTPSMLWVRRHLLTLAAYRDDCHLDAWQSQYEVPGCVFETFTFLWQADANTAAALVEALPYRSYTEEDYAHTLEELVKLGWAQKEGEEYALTEDGRNRRDEVETRTNKNYQAAFAVLTGEELDELIGLIEKLTAAIAPEVEEEAQQS